MIVVLMLAIAIQSPKAAEFASAPAMVRAPVMPMAVPVDMSGVIGLTWTGVTNASGYTLGWGGAGSTNFISTSNTIVWITNVWSEPKYKFQVRATNQFAVGPFSASLFVPPLAPTNVVLSWTGSSATISSSPSPNIPRAQWPLLTNATGSNLVLKIEPPRRFFTADKPLTIKFQ